MSNTRRCSRALLTSVLVFAASVQGQAQVGELAHKLAAIIAERGEKQGAERIGRETSRAGLDKRSLESLFAEDKTYFAGSTFAAKGRQDFSQLADDAFRTIKANGKAADYLIPSDRSVMQLVKVQNASRPPAQRLEMALSNGQIVVSSPGAWWDATVDMQAFKDYISRLAIAAIVSDLQLPAGNGSR